MLATRSDRYTPASIPRPLWWPGSQDISPNSQATKPSSNDASLPGARGRLDSCLYEAFGVASETVQATPNAEQDRSSVETFWTAYVEFNTSSRGDRGLGFAVLSRSRQAEQLALRNELPGAQWLFRHVSQREPIQRDRQSVPNVEAPPSVIVPSRRPRQIRVSALRDSGSCAATERGL